MTILNETKTSKQFDTKVVDTEKTMKVKKLKKAKRFRSYAYLVAFLSVSLMFFMRTLANMINIAKAANGHTYKITKDSIIVNYVTIDASIHTYAMVSYLIFLVVFAVVTLTFVSKHFPKMVNFLIIFMLMIAAAGALAAPATSLMVKRGENMINSPVSVEEKNAFIESHIGADYENVIIGDKRAYLTPENKFYELNDKLEGRTRTWTLDELKR
jgi:hypothetical protein